MRCLLKDVRKNFSCRIEELPVLGGFLKQSFVNYRQDFEDYSPDFNQSYLDKFTEKLDRVTGIVYPEKLTEELKVTTKRLYATLASLRDPLNKIEGYVERAENLTTGVNGFQIKNCRAALSRKDVEKLIKYLGILNAAVKDNFDRLTEKGLKPELRDFFVDVLNSIASDNQQQNDKMNEKAELVENNIDVLNELWDLMQDVMKTGKRIYKHVNESRTKEFTMTVLMERVRSERKAKEEEPEV